MLPPEMHRSPLRVHRSSGRGFATDATCRLREPSVPVRLIFRIDAPAWPTHRRCNAVCLLWWEHKNREPGTPDRRVVSGSAPAFFERLARTMNGACTVNRCDDARPMAS